MEEVKGKYVILAMNVKPDERKLFEETLNEHGIGYYVESPQVLGGIRNDDGLNNEMPFVDPMTAIKYPVGYTIWAEADKMEQAVKLLTNMGFGTFDEDAYERNLIEKLVSPMNSIPFLAKYSATTKFCIMAVGIALVAVALLYEVEYFS